MTKPFGVPIGDEDTWSDIVIKELDANTKAHYVLLQTLMMTILLGSSIVNHEIWTHLVVTHEGRHKLREQKLISYVPNMKISPCMKIAPLMTW